MPMTQEVAEAVAVLERVCAQTNANLTDHQIMQQSLAIIKAALDTGAGTIVPMPDSQPQRAPRAARRGKPTTPPA